MVFEIMDAANAGLYKTLLFLFGIYLAYVLGSVAAFTVKHHDSIQWAAFEIIEYYRRSSRART